MVRTEGLIFTEAGLSRTGAGSHHSLFTTFSLTRSTKFPLLVIEWAKLDSSSMCDHFSFVSHKLGLVEAPKSLRNPSS